MINNLLGGKVKNGCDQSGYETLILNVSQEWALKIDRFFTWSYKFKKAKIASIILGRCGLLFHETLKYAIS